MYFLLLLLFLQAMDRSIVQIHQTNLSSLYLVRFDQCRMLTMVTRSPAMVTNWLRLFYFLTNYYVRHGRSQRGIVSLQACMTGHRVHTLHICIGPSCLIFQIQNALSIPHSLVCFLADWHFTFVGVNNMSDIQRLLLIQYDMNIWNRVALFELVREYYRGLQEQMYEELYRELRQDMIDNYFEWLNQEMVYYGWTQFASLFGIQIRVPLVVTHSDWSTLHLQNSQILYASLEAWFCFELARFIYNFANSIN